MGLAVASLMITPFGVLIVLPSLFWYMKNNNKLQSAWSYEKHNANYDKCNREHFSDYNDRQAILKVAEFKPGWIIKSLYYLGFEDRLNKYEKEKVAVFNEKATSRLFEKLNAGALKKLWEKNNEVEKTFKDGILATSDI